MLPLVVIVKVKEGHREAVKESYLSILEPTRKGNGCIVFDFFEDNKDPNTFVLYEVWESYEIWQKHRTAEHITAHMNRTKDLVHERILFELTKLEN